MKKIHSLAYNTTSGNVYVYPIGDEYKRYILRCDIFGYFFKRKGIIERITNIEEVEQVKNYLNN